MFSYIANGISFVILCAFFYGRSLRKKNVQLHIKIMTGVMASDLVLILTLVFARSALAKVHLSMPSLLVIHICFAISTVVLYGFAAFYGLKLKKGEKQYLKQMRRVDKILTPFRVLTLVTSLSLMFI